MTAPAEHAAALLREDLTTRAAYVSDASIYRRMPAAVAEPRSVQEVRDLLALARARGWPVTARGGGTSVAGNAIGDGLVIDTSRHFDRVLSVDPDTATAVIEPGVVCDQLRAAAAEHGLTYGPDPSTHSRCTVGGMVANNACGSHSVAWGTAADNLVAVTVMLADGREVELRAGGSSEEDLTAALARLRDRHRAMLRTELGQFPRQVSGYGLHHLLEENGFHTARAFAGSEGTCGIITRLTVRLVRPPAHTALAVLSFPDAVAAAAAAPALRVRDVTTVEGMGGDLLAALRSRPGQEQAGAELPPGGGWLYCEVGGETPEAAAERARELPGIVAAAGRTEAAGVVVVADEDRKRALWRIREASAGIVTRLPDGGEAWPGWEDSAVPPEHLADYLRELYALLEDEGLRGIPFGHFGEGCVHIRISFDFTADDGVAAYRRFIERAARLVHRYGGSVSGEHGDGRARSELLSTIYSEQAREAFAEFKAVFDPEGVFNPGVLVDPEPIDQGVRPGPGARTFDLRPVHALSHDGGSFAAAVNRCVGVGACRSDAGAMCPSFMATGDEVHSTRGRMRSLAEMLRGEHLDGWDSRETLQALDLCLSCRACATECPVNVDMATYKSEFLHHHYGEGLRSFLGRGRRPMAHLTMGWLPVLARLMHRAPGLPTAVNAALRVPALKRLAMTLGGVEPRRRMIRFADRSLRRWFDQRPQAAGSGRPGEDPDGRPSVVLWPDSWTNFMADGPGRAAVEVLEAMGYRVLMPMGEVCCGMTWHSTGQLDALKREVTRTLGVMEPLLEAGFPVIGLEPSCTVMLQDEITELLPEDPRAALLAERTVSFGSFTAEHLRAGGPWPFRRLDEADGAATGPRTGAPAATPAVCQVHCHQKSSRGYDAELSVLAALGVAGDVVGGACCGLAGNFGFEPGHLEISRALGERTLFPAVRAAGPDPLVVADGFSCRTQIAEGTEATGRTLAEVMHSALRAP